VEWAWVIVSSLWDRRLFVLIISALRDHSVIAGRGLVLREASKACRLLEKVAEGWASTRTAVDTRIIKRGCGRGG
jgi:hypothetical protein